MQLCKYKHIFGAEGEGAHSVRVANIAIVDVVLTVIAGIVLAHVFKWSVGLTLLLLFATGILMHRLFCVNTTVNKWIFGVV